MPAPLSRRRFLGRAAAAGAGLCLPAAAAEKPAAGAPAPAVPATPVPDWPRWTGSDERALLDVLRSGRWGRTSGGARVKAFESAFAARMQAKHCVATSSGTTALLTALGALGIGPGDEVVIPPYTFVATFNAVTASFALPVFVDSDAATFQIDATKVAAAITPATRLLLPVHIAGSPCDLDRLAALAAERKITLLEDACQAPLAEWRGRPVGTRGLGGCFSFQASKNLTAGEGGAVLTDDRAFADACYDFHTPGNAKRAPSVGRGANFRITEFQAALLVSQMETLEAQAKLRDANAALLTAGLAAIPGIAPAGLTPGTTRSGWHLFMFRYDAAQFAGLSRAKFLAALAKAGFAASTGYTALNTSAHVQALAANPHYRRIYGAETMARWAERNACPVNDRLVTEAVWFGQTKLLGSRADTEKIVAAVADIRRRAGALAKA